MAYQTTACPEKVIQVEAAAARPSVRDDRCGAQGSPPQAALQTSVIALKVAGKALTQPLYEAQGNKRKYNTPHNAQLHRRVRPAGPSAPGPAMNSLTRPPMGAFLTIRRSAQRWPTLPHVERAEIELIERTKMSRAPPSRL